MTDTIYGKNRNYLHDRASGALLGGLIGDAFGGRYEFMPEYRNQLANDRLYSANNDGVITMFGGGVWNLTPGQITDDSEIALTLAQSILDKKCFNQEYVAKKYNEWYLSDPFDIGSTTKNSFCRTDLDHMIHASKLFNDKSRKDNGTNALSNGCLMRISPLCIWTAGFIESSIQKILSPFNDSNLSITSMLYHMRLEHKQKLRLLLEYCVDIMSQDTILTHNSDEAISFCAFFLMLSVSGILTGRLDEGFEWIKIMNQFLPDCNNAYIITMNATKPDAKLVHAPTENIGDLRIAFQLAIRKALMCQKNSMTFTEAIISTVNLGGDTDTNACIVGIMCGSVLGAGKFPTEWIKSVINAKPIRYHEHKPLNLIKNPYNLSIELFELCFKIIDRMVD